MSPIFALLKMRFGRAGLQYSLPAVWNGSDSRGIGPERLAQWFSERPAEIAGLRERKGRLAVGLDADLLVSPPAVQARLRDLLLVQCSLAR